MSPDILTSRDSHFGTADSVGLDLGIVGYDGADCVQYLGGIKSRSGEISIETARWSRADSPRLSIPPFAYAQRLNASGEVIAVKPAGVCHLRDAQAKVIS